MLRICLKNPESGWAFASLSDDGNELMVTGPYSPVDLIRELADAVQSLETTGTADCCWPQEPGELHWRLRRSGSDMELEILRFSDIGFSGQHRGEAVFLFKARTKWITFARQLLSSLESIETDMGVEGYERAWRHPFPAEAYRRLRNTVQKEKSIFGI